MAEPERALTVRELDIGGKFVGRDQLVWVHRRGETDAEVEFKGLRGRVPASALVPYPVPRPALEILRALDPCFGLPDEHFEVEHCSSKYFYELLKCRAHGRRFLRDARGTSAWYSTTTLLDEDDVGDPDDIWSRYHGRSHSWLMLEKRTW